MQAHVQARAARLVALEDRYTKKILRVLLRQLEACVAVVKAGGSPELVAAQIGPNPIKELLQELYIKVVQAEAKQEYLYLLSLEQKGVLPVSEWLRRARNFVQVQLGSTVRGITNTSRKQVKQVLQESLTKGTSVADTVRELRAKVTVLSKKRARTIAISELNAASNYGSLVGAQTSGLKLDKVWLATSDGRTRETHDAANGQRVDLNAHFEVGGEQCEFPGDVSLSPAERCRCRCTQVYKKKPQPQQGSLAFEG